MPRISFSPYEIEAIRRCAEAVWREIAYDIFVMMAQQEQARTGKNTSPERVTIRRSDVIELVLDADRLKTMMERKLNDMGRAIYEKIEKADSRTVMRIMREAFPHANYGM